MRRWTGEWWVAALKGWLGPDVSWGAARGVALAAWRASRPLAAAELGVAVAAGVFPIVQMVMVGTVIGRLPDVVRDRGAGDGDTTLYIALGALAVAYLVAQCAPVVQWSMGRLLGTRLDADIRRSVMTVAFRLPGLTHLDNGRVTEAATLAREARSSTFGSDDAVRALANLVSGRVQGLIAAGVLVAFHWWAPLVLFGTFIPWDRFFRLEHRKVAKGWVSQTPEQARAAYFRGLGTDAAAGKEMRVFGLSGFVQRRFREHFLAAMVPIWRQRAIGIRRFLPRVLLVWVGYLVVFGALGWELATGRQSLTAATLYVLVAGQIWRVVPGFNDLSRLVIGSGPLLSAQRAIAEAESARTTAGARDEGARSTANSVEGSAEGSGAATPLREIRFEGVSFTYPRPEDGTYVEVFRNLDLRITVGQSLGIVGDNGAGKTTLVKLLCGLYAPTSGRITVDGVDLATMDTFAWRRHLTAVFQDYVHYPVTVRENVAWGAGGALDGDGVRVALADADATGLVDSLVDGTGTVLGRGFDGGVELSGGQWQKIAVARALAGLRAGATVLVLDEPTANLDVRTEAALFERILTLAPGLTTLLISHRFANVRRADRIVVLDGGRVVEDGSHDELMAAGGRYAEMFRIQAARFQAEPSTAKAGADRAGESR